MKKTLCFAALIICISCTCTNNSQPVETSQTCQTCEQTTCPTAAIDTAKTDLELSLEEIGLVDIESITDDIPVSLMYTRADNFTGKVLYKGLNRAYLHPEAAEALIKAQQLLKEKHPGLSLKVYDAARPMSVQKAMFDTVKGTPQNIYVANPAKGGGLHNYGLAVDVTLCHAETGDTLTMGTHIDYFGERAQVIHEKKYLSNGELSQEAYQNRLILREVMTAAGYKTLPTEWWHFNFRNINEAKKSYTLIP